MRIAICDDLPDQIKRIKDATIEYFQSQKETVEIFTYLRVFDFLDEQAKSNFDLVLLDICMPGLLGTEAAKEIRARNDKTEIIFLTTSNEFAIDAFEVNALHYLLKPFTKEVFHQAMGRAMLQMAQNQKKMMIVKCPKGVIRSIDKDSISYIEGSKHRQSVVLHDGTSIEAVETMYELHNHLESLSKDQFINPYKGFIVNQKAISVIENDKIILKSGVKIPIPRRTFHVIKQAYFDYMFGGKQ